LLSSLDMYIYLLACLFKADFMNEKTSILEFNSNSLKSLSYQSKLIDIFEWFSLIQFWWRGLYDLEGGILTYLRWWCGLCLIHIPYFSSSSIAKSKL